MCNTINYLNPMAILRKKTMKYIRYFLIALTLTSTPLVAMHQDSESGITFKILTDYELIDEIAGNCLDLATLMNLIRVVSITRNDFATAYAIVSQGLKKSGKSICDFKDEKGWTALHWAIAADDMR